MNLFRSTAVVGGLTLVSRIAGFAREILTAAALGAGPVTDAFFIAFRFPNLFRRVFAEGAFSAAFVPLYAGRMEQEGKASADRLACETFTILSLALFALVVAATAAMPWLMIGLAPGYAAEADWMGQAIFLAQVMMPYIAFMSLTAMFGGVLNAVGRFAAFALAPVLLNIILIAVLVGAPLAGCGAEICDPDAEKWRIARWLSFGVVAAGLAQLAFVWAGARRQGLRVRFVTPRLTPGVKRVIALGVPGAAAAGVTQINIVIGQIIASLRESAVSWLSFADRIYQLPLGMIGIALGVALLPALSRHVKAGDEVGARDSLNSALEIAALFSLPAAAALLAAPEFFIKAVFEHGQFTSGDARATALALMAYAAGLPGFIAVKVLSPAYFAREDTRTPMRFAAVTVVVNVVVGAGLFFAIGREGLGFVGLAAGTSIAGYVNAILLAVGLARRGHFAPSARLIARVVRIGLASALMGAGMWGVARYLTPFLDAGLARDVAVAGLGALAGFAIYALAAVVLGAARPRDLRAALKRA